MKPALTIMSAKKGEDEMKCVAAILVATAMLTAGHRSMADEPRSVATPTPP